MENMTVQTMENTVLGEIRNINVITEEIRFYKQQAGAAILEIGRRLIEAKEQLSHGEWLPWLEEKVEFSEASAQRFMRLAREYSNPSPVTDLGVSKALVLLALPASEREDFVAEKHIVNGEEKSAFEMSKRELENAIRERDEARKNIAGLQELVTESENKVKGIEKALEVQKDAAEKELREAEAVIEDLRSQLKELQEAPVAVSVERVVDKEAVEAAKKSAIEATEKKLKSQIEKAEKAKAAAEKEKAKAEQELASIKVDQENARAVADRERQAMSEQVATLQKKLAVASSSEMVIFKLHFEQGQGSINKMLESIERMAEGGDSEGAEKLKNALRALLSTTLSAVK